MSKSLNFSKPLIIALTAFHEKPRRIALRDHREGPQGKVHWSNQSLTLDHGACPYGPPYGPRHQTKLPLLSYQHLVFLI